MTDSHLAGATSNVPSRTPDKLAVHARGGLTVIDWHDRIPDVATQTRLAAQRAVQFGLPRATARRARIWT